jgi:RNA polymerase sigma-70 factor (ECF subfamily)
MCVGSREVAEDITSDVFLVLHRELDTMDTARLPGWLFVVARNRAMDYWRRVAIEQRYVDALPPPETTWVPSLEFLLTTVKALKPIHRACLILRYVHGMNRVEIAKHLGLSEMQVKGHLQYTLTILRRELEKSEP